MPAHKGLSAVLLADRRVKGYFFQREYYVSRRQRGCSELLTLAIIYRRVDPARRVAIRLSLEQQLRDLAETSMSYRLLATTICLLSVSAA